MKQQFSVTDETIATIQCPLSSFLEQPVKPNKTREDYWQVWNESNETIYLGPSEACGIIPTHVHICVCQTQPFLLHTATGTKDNTYLSSFFRQSTSRLVKFLLTKDVKTASLE